jgi:hypothetical protein
MSYLLTRLDWKMIGHVKQSRWGVAVSIVTGQSVALAFQQINEEFRRR